MIQTERRKYLIAALLKELPQYPEIEIPTSEEEQKALLRSLFNIRMPAPASEAFLTVQDAYLQEEIRQKGITAVDDLQPFQDRLYLWQGDITTLKCGAIVNAANSRMLGCFVPRHKCIDNAIHTYAGVRLRMECAALMDGGETITGSAKITNAYNLPCAHILHTVGPIVRGTLTERDCELLASCYRSCLDVAEKHGITSVAFCCISTGEFHFPNEKAAEIAIQTVTEYLEKSDVERVIFNVFKDEDYRIYKRLLTNPQTPARSD